MTAVDVNHSPAMVPWGSKRCNYCFEPHTRARSYFCCDACTKANQRWDRPTILTRAEVTRILRRARSRS